MPRRATDLAICGEAMTMRTSWTETQEDAVKKAACSTRFYALHYSSCRVAGKSGVPLRARGGTASGILFAREDGNALVEFAMVAPVMLMIMMGIIVIGSVMSNYLQLIEATSSAARTVAVSRSNTLNPCTTVTSAVSGGAPLLNSANMTYTLALNNSAGTNLGTYGPTTGSLSCSSTSYTSGPPSYLQQGGSATVTVTYPCNLSIYGKNYWSGCTLQAQTTEMIQ
jgi:Flp pilus assembly protein TadG